VSDTWTDSLREARDVTAYTGTVPEHTVAAVRASIPDRLSDEFESALSAVGDGDEFSSFLDDWWVTAVEHTADDRDAAEKFAMLAVSLDRTKNPGKAWVYDDATDAWREYHPKAVA
jgi:hypothetical protein